MVSHRRVRQLADPKFKCAQVAKAMKAHACMHAQSLSCVQLFATPWTVARQAPLSMGFSRQEYWSRLSFPSLGHITDPGIMPVSPALVGAFFTTEPPGKIGHV